LKVKKVIGGFSLVETILALTVIAVIMVAGLGRYQQYKAEANIARVNTSVTLVQQALTDYFFQNCHQYPHSLPLVRKFTDIKELFNDIGESGKTIINPLGDNYVAEITDKGAKDTSTKYTLVVSAKFNLPPEVLQNYKRLLNASGCMDENGTPDPSCSSQILFWQKLPWYSTPGTESNLWILNGGLQKFVQAHPDACTGRVKNNV
jgi:type II secretory pathway pseudopilin PulG